MKDYAWVFALGLVLAFFVAMGYISTVQSETKMKQDIECIEAGGQVQTFPHACVKGS